MSYEPLSDLVGPDISIYRFTDNFYKIVHFKSTAPRLGPLIDRDKPRGTTKLDASLSRARRVILELALCNDWTYFCTFTIAKEKFDRSDLATWHSSFTQWLRDARKRYLKKGYDFKIDFLLIPERHDDGSWHMHGLFSDISPVLVSFRELYEKGYNVPWKLVEGGFYNWPEYQKKYGFCSFGLIRNKIATAFYITKYITKSLEDNCLDVGLHLYYPSKPLNRPTKHGDIYSYSDFFNQYLTHHYDFCDTGFVSVSGDHAWAFGFEYMDIDMIEAFKVDEIVSDPEIDLYFEGVQQILDGF